MTQPKFASARGALQRIALVAPPQVSRPDATAQTAPAATPAPAAPAAAPTQTPPFNGIAHIAIRVQSIADSLAFYNKLGYQQAFANTGRGGIVSSPSSRSTTSSSSSSTRPSRPTRPGRRRVAEHYLLPPSLP